MLILLPGCWAPEDTLHRVIGNGANVSIFDVGNETETIPLLSAVREVRTLETDDRRPSSFRVRGQESRTTVSDERSHAVGLVSEN